MAGPPPAVAAAAPIPTASFNVPVLGTAFKQVASASHVYQQHTGQPNFIPPALSPQTAAAMASEAKRNVGNRWQNVWTYWVGRFRTLQAIPGPGPTPGG